MLASTFKLTHYPEFAPVRKLPALAVRLPDRPGALHQVTAVLSRAAINIENASGFAVSGGDAILILEVADLPAAERALAEADFNTLRGGVRGRGGLRPAAPPTPSGQEQAPAERKRAA